MHKHRKDTRMCQREKFFFSHNQYPFHGFAVSSLIFRKD